MMDVGTIIYYYPTDGYLHYFKCLSTTKNPAINILLLLFYFTGKFFSIISPRSRIAGSMRTKHI